MPESVLVNYMDFHAVGHVVEALRYGLGYHAADPGRQVDVAVNGKAGTTLADLCPFVRNAYAVMPSGPPDAALAEVSGEWDWVVDNPTRRQAGEMDPYPWLAAYYAASDGVLRARRGRSVAGVGPPSYVPHQNLRFELPDEARGRAARRLPPDGSPMIAVMPAGGTGRWLYPSVDSWVLILEALEARHPGTTLGLTGKLARDIRSRSSFSRVELDEILARVPSAVDLFDIGLVDQLAAIERADLFLSPHTGFGMAVLCVGTPWLTLSGGSWQEFFFNGVPFYSVLPDPQRFRAFGGLRAVLPRPSRRDGLRIPSASHARVLDDLDELLDAADLLISGRLTYEEALAGHFSRLLERADGDASGIWSFDDIHHRYVDAPYGRAPDARPSRVLTWISRFKYRNHL